MKEKIFDILYIVKAITIIFVIITTGLIALGTPAFIMLFVISVLG